MLLAPRTRRLGALAAIALFIGVFPANINSVGCGGTRRWPARIGAIARLPLQIPMITQAFKVYRNASLGVCASNPASSSGRAASSGTTVARAHVVEGRAHRRFRARRCSRGPRQPVDGELNGGLPHGFRAARRLAGLPVQHRDAAVVVGEDRVDAAADHRARR